MNKPPPVPPPSSRNLRPRNPAPGPVDTARESVAGEEDPGAAQDPGDEAFNQLPPGLDHPG